MEDVLLRERRGHVEILTINRPEARNAVNGAVSKAVGGALDELTEDPEAWVVVLTGSGDKAFSAGMDLKAFAAGEGAAIIDAPGGFGGVVRRDFPKPLIAALNGSALAGGCEIMLACDLVVAADHAKIGVPEVQRGLLAGAGALLRLPRRIPAAVAMELVVTGDAIDVHRAYELGLVNRVVPYDRLMDETMALAERIAANAPLAVRTSREVLRRAGGLPEEQAWPVNDAAALKVFSSEDAMEGPVAFAEKRPPRWKGR